MEPLLTMPNALIALLLLAVGAAGKHVLSGKPPLIDPGNKMPAVDAARDFFRNLLSAWYSKQPAPPGPSSPTPNLPALPVDPLELLKKLINDAIDSRLGPPKAVQAMAPGEDMAAYAAPLREMDPNRQAIAILRRKIRQHEDEAEVALLAKELASKYEKPAEVTPLPPEAIAGKIGS